MERPERVYTLTVIDRNGSTHHVKVIDNDTTANVVNMVQWLRDSPYVKKLTYSLSKGDTEDVPA